MTTHAELQANYQFFKQIAGNKHPYHLFGFETPTAWNEILKELASKIQLVIESQPEATFFVSQVKSKFGGLRFYFDWTGDAASYNTLNALVEEAELRADRTCEITGHPGQLRTIGRHSRVLSETEYQSQLLNCPTHKGRNSSD